VVILFSGQARTEQMLDEARAGGHNFEVLPKPVHPRELLSRIKSGLRLE
jgi:DNA-binding response OmpR family regulator